MGELGIDIKLLVAQVINFLLFFYIFKKFIAKPFLDYLVEQKKIKEDEDFILAEAKKKSSKILTDAKREANKLKEEILKQAKIEAEEMKLKAKRQLEEEKMMIYKEAKRKTVEVASVIAKTVLKEFIDEKLQGELLKNLFNKFEKSRSYEN